MSSIKDLKANGNTSVHLAIDKLIESSKLVNSGGPADRRYHLEWIPYSELRHTEIFQSFDNQTIYYGTHEKAYNIEHVMLLFLGNNDTCTQAFIDELARIYSIPSPRHNDTNTPNINEFKRYSIWLDSRNRMIEGFTSDNDDNY